MKMQVMKKRRIIASHGSSSISKSVVQKKDRVGVGIFRINLSHTNLEEFEQIEKHLIKVINGKAKYIRYT